MYNYQHPVTVVHRGSAVLLCIGIDDAGGPAGIFYNILDTSSQQDSATWNGYRALAMPAETAPAGFSLLRTQASAPVGTLLSALSDQEYVYLFQSSDQVIWVNRYVMVDVPAPNLQGGTMLALQPAWEVRFQRSGNADLPFGDQDTLSALGPDSTPYLEPLYELPIDPAGLALDSASFAVLLEPAADTGDLRWQFFLTHVATGAVHTYSFARTADGWPALDASRLAPGTGWAIPDAVIALRYGDTPLLANGSLAACNYFKQEPTVLSATGAVKLKRMARALLAVPVMLDAQQRMATIDFAIATDGTLSQPQTDAGGWTQAGQVAPSPFVLAFDGTGALKLPDDTLVLPAAFTLEAWVCPDGVTLTPQVVIGGTVDGAHQAPTLWLENGLQLAASYSDGTTLHTALSDNNVLAPGAWTHVAAVADAGTITLYINGDPVPATMGSVAGGASAPVTAIGANGNFSTVHAPHGALTLADTLHDALLGMLDEVRVWSAARTQAELKTYLFEPIAAPDAKKMATLAGYWRLDDGSGSVAIDLSSFGRNAMVAGAHWVVSTSPLSPAADAALSIDARGLATYVGLLLPEADAPGFIDLANGSRPALLDGADGWVHLYFRREGSGQFGVAHYETTIERASYGLPWAAGAAPAAALNNATIAGHSQADGYLCTLTLSDGLGVTETWRGVPRRVDTLLQILNGATAGTPQQAALPGTPELYYDYAGTRNIGVAGCDPLTQAVLWLTANRLHDFSLSGAVYEPAQQQCTLTFSSDAAHAQELIRFVLHNLPADAAGLTAALAGTNPAYDYAAAGVAAGARAFTLAGTVQGLTLIAPSEALLASGAMTVGPAADAALCTLHIALTLADGTTLAADWATLPRAMNEAVAALRAPATPEQKAVMDRLRVVAPEAGAGMLLDGGASDDVRAALALMSIRNDGCIGTVPAFDCALSPIQGASNGSAILARGSQLFASVNEAPASNGFPAVLAIDAQGAIGGVLLRPGRNGGWVFEPPRIALQTQLQGCVKAALDPVTIGALAPPAALTLEAWASLNVPLPGRTSFYPRLVHANLPDLPGSPRYMLGLAAGNCLKIVQQSGVTSDDHATTNPLKVLFPNNDYTVQFYVNPDLSSLSGDANQLYQRRSSKGSEALRLSAAGALTYTFTSPSGETTSSPPIALIDGQWQLLALSMAKRQMTLTQLYLPAGSAADAAPTVCAVTLGNVPDLGGPGSAITLAGNMTDAALQGQLSTFSIWRRATSGAELAASFNQPVLPSAANLQLLWGLDGSSTVMAVPNVAQATEGLYDTTATGAQTYWAYPGLFYRAFFGVGMQAVQTRYAVAGARQWHQYAGRYQPHFGIRCGPDAYADCGNDQSLNTQSMMSIEAWVEPRQPNLRQRQAIVSRFGERPELRSYELGIGSDNRPCFTLRLDGVKTPAGEPALERDCLRTFAAPTPLAAGASCYLVGTVSIASFADRSTPEATGSAIYSVVGQLYVNGVPTLDGPARPAPVAPGTTQTYTVKVLGGSGSGRYLPGATVSIGASDVQGFARWYSSADVGLAASLSSAATSFTMPAQDVTLSAIGGVDALYISASDSRLLLGAAPDNQLQASSPFLGTVSDVRLWASELGAGAVRAAYASHQAPPASDNLVSSYSFGEQAGMIAYDSQSNNNARLRDSGMWSVFHDGATMDLLVDGVPVPGEAVALAGFGDYGAAQFRVGGSRDSNNVFSNPFIGSIDELRLWREARTNNQIAENAHRYLAGNEDGLAAYWNFSAGSGSRVQDATGNGNTLEFDYASATTIPRWLASTAPVASEAPPVLNVLGGLDLPAVALLTEGPSVFEYGDSEVDARGKLVATMKRGYAYVTAQGMQLWTNYRVGDLRTVYIGQVQTQPTLIGFVEGAPPLPAENMTRPYYRDPSGYFGYDNAASVTLTQSAATSVSLSASRSDSRGVAMSAAFGASGDIKVFNGVQVPMGPVIMYQQVSMAWQAGIKTELSWEADASHGSGLVQDYARNTSMTMGNGGTWEAPGQQVLASGERRYLPANVGCALVKSATANLYATFLRASGALVGYQVVPDLTIPIDSNLLYFPLNPQYTCAGSLDGNTGLQPDPRARGGSSYFVPAEAYAWQRASERQAAQATAWYQQFDAAGRADSQNAGTGDMLASAPLYDWEHDVARKTVVNKYVWSAAGGLYTEQESYGSEREESFGGSYALNWKLGAGGSIQGDVGPIGLFFQADLLGGTGWTVTVNKSKTESRAIDLAVAITPDNNLLAFTGRDTEPFYSAAPAAGKVDGYRFTTNYLAPSVANTDAFFSTVIDPVWLAQSPSPQAVALRQARAISSGQRAWRIAHRVTFVSRVPPSFQAVPVESAAPPVADPARVAQNALFVGLLAGLVPGADPTPGQLGDAVTTILGPVLSKTLPWWDAFLVAAAQPNSAEALRLRTLRTDLLAYAEDYYAAR